METIIETTSNDIAHVNLLNKRSQKLRRDMERVECSPKRAVLDCYQPTLSKVSNIINKAK